MDWRVVLLIVGFLLATSGCTCAYKVADRDIVLERGVRSADVETALKQVNEIRDISFHPERRYRVWFVLPARDPASFHFRTHRPEMPFGGMHGFVNHFDGSAKLSIRAQTMNRAPIPQDEIDADLLFFRIEQQLRRMTSQQSGKPAEN